MKLHAFGGRGGDVCDLCCKVEKRFHGHLCVLCFCLLKKIRSLFKVGF